MGKEEKEPTFEELVEQLRSENNQQRMDTLNLLGISEHKKATDVLIELIVKDTEDIEFQKEAMLTLGKIGNPKSIRIFESVLRYELEKFQNFNSLEILAKYIDFYKNELNKMRLCVFSLNNLGKDPYNIYGDKLLEIVNNVINNLVKADNKESILFLKQILKLDFINPNIREEAIWAIGSIGGKQELDTIIEVAYGVGLGSTHRNYDNEETSRRAVWELGSINEGKALDALVNILLDDAYDVCWTDDYPINVDIINILGKQEEGRGILPLLYLLEDSLAGKRWRNLTEQGKEDRCIFIRETIEKLVDEKLREFFTNPEISNEDKDLTAQELGNLKFEGSVDPLIDVINYEDGEVGGAAIYALGLLGNKKAVQPLLDYFCKRNSHWRNIAALALGRLGDQRAIKPLLRELDLSESYIIRETIEALAELQAVEAIKPLKEKLSEEIDDEILELIKQTIQKLEMSTS